MSFTGKFYSFLDVTVTLTFPDATTSTFQIQAPTARNPFQWGWTAISGRKTYRDGNYSLQRRRELYQFMTELSYNFHRMEIVDLFRASQIELKIPIWWGPATYYIPFNCILDRSDVMNEAYGGIMGGKISDLADQAGIIPRAATSLRFIGVDTFAWDEIGSDVYPMLPPATPIALDVSGVETPLIGLKFVEIQGGTDLILQEINDDSPALPGGTTDVRWEGVEYPVADVTILPFST